MTTQKTITPRAQSRRTWLRVFAMMALPMTLWFISARPAQAAEPSAEDILRKADDVRNPAENYFLRVKVTSSNTSDISEFEVFIRGKDKTVVKTVQPARDKGRNMLMVNENMWAYVPNLKRSVRVSLNQRLVGQTANGDISRMRWSGDYAVQIEGQNDKEWTLLLKATKKGLTYEQLRVWVEKGSFHPVRAEYLSSAGKVLKRASFRAYKELCGRVRPSEIAIHDAVKKDDHSVIQVLLMEVKTAPDSMFYPDNLQ